MAGWEDTRCLNERRLPRKAGDEFGRDCHSQALRPTPPPAAILGRDKAESMAEMQLANYPTHARRRQRAASAGYGTGKCNRGAVEHLLWIALSRVFLLINLFGLWCHGIPTGGSLT